MSLALSVAKNRLFNLKRDENSFLIDSATVRPSGSA